MQKIVEQQKLIDSLYKGIKDLLGEQLLPKLQEANRRNLVVIDIDKIFGSDKDIAANAVLIQEIKELAHQYKQFRIDLKKAKEELGSMCYKKYTELKSKISQDESKRVNLPIIEREYNTCVAYGGMIPFLEQLDQYANYVPLK